MKNKIKYIKAWIRDKIVIMEKSAYKTAKKPPVKKKKRKKERKKERKDDRERVVDFGEKPIMLRWPYL